MKSTSHKRKFIKKKKKQVTKEKYIAPFGLNHLKVAGMKTMMLFLTLIGTKQGCQLCYVTG
jgi:hypothetical protein